MDTQELAEFFLNGRIQMVENTDTEKLNQIIIALSKDETIVELLPILTAHPDAVEFLQRIITETEVPTNILFKGILKSLNLATPAYDSKDVML